MNIHYRSKRIILVFITVLMFLSILPIKANEKKVIRVGYTFQDGLSMKDKNGNYYGYDYDYLMQIAQYTGWEYEFVELKGNINERLMSAMDMLEKGEIDLLGGLKYSDSLAMMYDYASEPYGNAYNVLYVKDDSDLIDVDSLINKKDLKIAVFKTAGKRLELLDRFAQMSGIHFEKVERETKAELIDAVANNEADAILSVDLDLMEGHHSIARFSPDPFYFVTTKGNTQIINDLNNALTNINKINPTFTSATYERYFGFNSNTVTLSALEKLYIKNKKEIKVLVHDGAGPIQYIRNGKAAGVGIDILEKLSDEVGIKVKYVYAKDNQDFTKKVENKEVDLILGLSHEISISDQLDVTLSDPYLSTNTLLVLNKKEDPTKLIDLCEATTLYNTNRRDLDVCGPTETYDTLEDSLLAVENSKSDYMYVNSYIYTFYMNKYDFKNISTFTTSDSMRSQYSFAIPKSKDFTLLSILNKSIRAQKSDLEAYVFRNAYKDEKIDLMKWITTHVGEVLLFILAGVVIVIGFMRRYYNKQLAMKKAVELEYMRYQMLSDISGEMSFSYDYVKSILKISNSGVGKMALSDVIENFRQLDKEDEKYSQVISDIYDYLKEQKDGVYEIKTMMLDQEEKWYQLSIKIIKSLNKNVEVAVYAVGKIIDIQKEKAENELLRQKTKTDILTGIYNRGAAQELISEALENETGLGALIMIDLDNFKTVNDSYGHLEGDRVLIETAQLLSQIYKDQIVARLGGDEFIIYVHHTSKQEIIDYCEKTLSQIHDLPVLQKSDFVLSLSMGIVFSSYSNDYETLMRRADEKLYEVKRSGRNGFHIFED